MSHGSRLAGGRPLSPCEEVELQKSGRRRKYVILGASVAAVLVLALLIGILIKIQGTGSLISISKHQVHNYWQF